MGFSYTVTPSGARRLDCDFCGNAAPGTRKRPCPAGWCPAFAACSACWRSKRAETVKHHADCKRRRATYAAEVAAEKDKLYKIRFTTEVGGEWHEVDLRDPDFSAKFAASLVGRNDTEHPEVSP